MWWHEYSPSFLRLRPRPILYSMSCLHNSKMNVVVYQVTLALTCIVSAKMEKRKKE